MFLLYVHILLYVMHGSLYNSRACAGFSSHSHRRGSSECSIFYLLVFCCGICWSAADPEGKMLTKMPGKCLFTGSVLWVCLLFGYFGCEALEKSSEELLFGSFVANYSKEYKNDLNEMSLRFKIFQVLMRLKT